MSAPQPPQPPSDAGAVGILVENHRRFLSFLERRVGSREDAEEILQAAFVRGVEKASTLESDESAVAWFYRVLRNAVTDYYRHRAAGKRALEAVARWTDEAAGERDPEVERAICGCIDALMPLILPDYATIVRRVDLRSEPIGAVADDLGITPGNARVRLHRARLALRRELERSCGTCAEHGCLDCACGNAPHC